eukprot:GGOE01021864.1.p5 GENE.GGOE01021864.1~~GGOE01021864.1.p5  ORF type:complete len:123 (-),score=3.12 GGOE01021864.1:550-918(-)
MCSRGFFDRGTTGIAVGKEAWAVPCEGRCMPQSTPRGGTVWSRVPSPLQPSSPTVSTCDGEGRAGAAQCGDPVPHPQPFEMQDQRQPCNVDETKKGRNEEDQLAPPSSRRCDWPDCLLAAGC